MFTYYFVDLGIQVHHLRGFPHDVAGSPLLGCTEESKENGSSAPKTVWIHRRGYQVCLSKERVELVLPKPEKGR